MTIDFFHHRCPSIEIMNSIPTMNCRFFFSSQFCLLKIHRKLASSSLQHTERRIINSVFIEFLTILKSETEHKIAAYFFHFQQCHVPTLLVTAFECISFEFNEFFFRAPSKTHSITTNILLFIYILYVGIFSGSRLCHRV